ncbi:MAG TPA: TRAM domain-containing protein [Mycobacteriales bacterium]|nr:TRAM domain-containing protein [Mycobacteriales bacterium]
MARSGAAGAPRRPVVRRPRPAERPPGPLLGRDLELEVGAVAHGGHCVARYEGRVVFVRHALPGERVLARVTEDTGGAFCRADAVEVLRPAAERVTPPCPHAGPGRCGGCDWQHASGPAQRELKAAVVSEQLARLAGLPGMAVEVAALPGGLLGWRSRLRFTVTPDGRTGLHRHRSAELEPVAECPLGTAGVAATGAGRALWPGAAAVQVVASTGGDRAIVVTPADPAARPALIGAGSVREQAAGREWTVAATGFWQVHPAAAETLAGCVLEQLAPRPGEVVLDLYAGAGLFAGALAGAVGPAGTVVAIEADPVAAADAAANLADLPWVEVRRLRITPALIERLGAGPDLVVLDPPRTGAGPELIAALLGAGPRAVAYVACDPAALARDLRTAVAAGYRLAALRAFDLFPMTHHVECVALLVPAGPAAPEPAQGSAEG